MTGWPRSADAMDDRQRAGIARALARWSEQRQPTAGGTDPAPAQHPAIVDVELLHGGRPGLLDVVADIGGDLAHVVFGLQRPGEQLRVLGAVEEPALGVLEDDEGFAVLVDAVHDADAARLLLHAVTGDGVVRRPRSAVTLVHDGEDAVILGFDRRYTFTVFPWLRRGPHPGVTLLAGLDEAGFNHLPAPVAFWRRAGRDLGVVQELVAGSAGGWALALTSLRDLIAAGVSPDTAGGDFAPESMALGTMTARMHLALERSFGRRDDQPETWARRLGAADIGSEERREDAPRYAGDAKAGRGAGAGPEAAQAALGGLAGFASAGGRLAVIRPHGDFHLGRTARTDHGWVVADTMPGGTDPETGEPSFRPPLADVADFLWSLRHAATVAAAERGPAAETSRVGELAEAWAARNRRAFMAAYLAVPGIGALVPTDREAVRFLLGAFEAAREQRRPMWARGPA